MRSSVGQAKPRNCDLIMCRNDKNLLVDICNSNFACYEFLMTQSISSQEIHRYSITILEHHLDFLGHVNNATYFELLEEARWDMITRLGFGVTEIKASCIGPVVLEARIQYKRELTLRQKITIETKFVSVKSSIFKIHQVIKNDSQQICCEADFASCFLDLTQRKIAMPPKTWLNAVGIEDIGS
jgi:thioesterase-3